MKSFFTIFLVFALSLVSQAMALDGTTYAPLSPRTSVINTGIVSSSKYSVVITGCNNNCQVACCYCNIHKKPPVCDQCCMALVP